MKWNSAPASVGRERGWTMIGGMIILCLLAFVVVIGFRLVPMYLDYFTVQSSLESLKSEPEVARMSKYDILASIQRRFDVGYVDVVTSKDVKIKQDKNGKFVELVYEDRRPLLANLEIVGKFNKTVYLE